MRITIIPTLALAALALAALTLMGCTAAPAVPEPTAHMVAEATLTAHYIAAAKAAGFTAEEINATLAEIARNTVIDEFWVTDENGNVEYTNVPGLDFKFPTDPDAGTQAAPFADLLLGEQKVVTQGMRPRQADGRMFQYVGAAGVDAPRIVQVGFAGTP